MTLGSADCAPLLPQRRTAARQLEHEMVPLVSDLALGDENRCWQSSAAHLAAIEGVATGHGLVMNSLQIGADREVRRRVRAKALELRMIPITAGAPAENGTGQ